MLEVNKLNVSKSLIKNLNIIIYGTIRDIEEHFLKSFSNIELLCNFFNNALIIIFENDSLDNTRNLLKSWASFTNPNIKKHIILENNLDEIYSLRAHRLAYCRNKILDYIFDNNLDNNYQYAIHCDLDDRFWCLDYDSICSCFQYDLNSWDAMFTVNKNYYYDFWALRCNETWFNKNIFSCEFSIDDNKEYEKHVPEFMNFLNNNKNNLISVQSAFNGLGIYKLSSIKYSRYSADYVCNKCNSKKTECLQDNDHIGLHKDMIKNNYKLFINKNMFIDCKKIEYINYSKFIKNMVNIKIINKNPLNFVLYNKLVDDTNVWLNFSENIGIFENTISNFTHNNIYTFCINDNNLFSNTFINNNVIKYIGDFSKNINNFLIKNNNVIISFLHIDLNNYYNTKKVLDKLYKKINNNCIIIFNKFINFKEYYLNDLNAFYEFSQKYNISFEYIGIKEGFSYIPNKYKNTEIAIKILNNQHLSNDIILDELYIYEDIFINFDWEKYVKKNKDLQHINIKEDAWNHWIKYGKNEGREYFEIKKEEIKNSNDNFDWKNYLKNNADLHHINTKEDAWNHWIEYGKKEGREYFEIKKEEIKNSNDNFDTNFDWENYLKNNADLHHINTKEDAWNHWIEYGKKEGRIYFDKKCLNKINFDWKYYIKNNEDLNHINTKEDAWNHWIEYGKNENRLFKKKNKKLNNLFDNFNI
jgi:hypothetical protein